MIEESPQLLGFDLVEVGRLRTALSRHPRLEQRLFTDAEVAYCHAHGDPTPHLAARFAAKESVGKALGTGVTSWREIEVATGPRSENPALRQSGGRRGCERYSMLPGLAHPYRGHGGRLCARVSKKRRAAGRGA